MGWRQRLQEGSAKVSEGAKAVAGSELLQRTGETLRGYRELLREADRPESAEEYLAALVRAVRDDERDDRESRRDLYVRARKRRRRLGMVTLGTGPMVGVSSRVADLYCEVAVVCDLADFHCLDLSDEEVGAQMLVLWSVVDGVEVARGAMRGSPPLSGLIMAKLGEGVDLPAEPPRTKLEWVKALWAARGIGEGVRSASGQPLRSVAFAGHRTKKLIKRAEAQLGATHAVDP